MRMTLLTLFLGWATAALPLAAQLGVSPTKFDLEIGQRPATESVRVFNFGKTPVEVEASVVNWELDENNRVRELPPTEQSLDQWIVINPLRFTIPPERSQTVRFSIRPRVEPEPGEHRGLIYFAQVPGKDEKRLFNYRVGLAIYGYVGEVTRIGDLQAVQVRDGTTVRFDLTSRGTGNVRFDGQYAIWPAEAFPGAAKTFRVEDLDDPGIELPPQMLEAGSLPTTPILPGTRRWLELELRQSLAAGEYVLDLNATLGDHAADQAFPFSVTQPEEESGTPD